MGPIGIEIGDIIDDVGRRGQQAQHGESKSTRVQTARVVGVPGEQGHEQEGVLDPLVRARRAHPLLSGLPQTSVGLEWNPCFRHLPPRLRGFRVGFANWIRPTQAQSMSLAPRVEFWLTQEHPAEQNWSESG
jgi:hypothetical protein